MLLLSEKVAMFSLRTQEKLDAERNQDSSRQILWRNLNDRKKSGRMVRRIYNKTRCVIWCTLKKSTTTFTRGKSNRNILATRKKGHAPCERRRWRNGFLLLNCCGVGNVVHHKLRVQLLLAPTFVTSPRQSGQVSSAHRKGGPEGRPKR